MERHFSHDTTNSVCQSVQLQENMITIGAGQVNLGQILGITVHHVKMLTYMAEHVEVVTPVSSMKELPIIGAIEMVVSGTIVEKLRTI